MELLELLDKLEKTVLKLKADKEVLDAEINGLKTKLKKRENFISRLQSIFKSDKSTIADNEKVINKIK